MSQELMKVEFESLSGIMVKLDAATVRNTLTRGNGEVTDQEVAMFLRTCQAKRLDPLENGEVYLIKYDNKAPANLVVGYFAYIRRADHFPDYRGFKAGITKDDATMIDFLVQSELPFAIVCTKCDKLNKTNRTKNLEEIRANPLIPEDVAIIPFSSHTGEGKDDVWGIIREYCEYLKEEPEQ